MKRADALTALALDMRAFEGWEAEYRFAPPRRWRFDYAFPAKKIGVELDGGTWSGGRHTTGSGFAKDIEKLNAAALEGWLVLRFTSGMVERGDHMAQIEQAISDEHRFCHTDFHRCDGGGSGEAHRYGATSR